MRRVAAGSQVHITTHSMLGPGSAGCDQQSAGRVQYGSSINAVLHELGTATAATLRRSKQRRRQHLATRLQHLHIHTPLIPGPGTSLTAPRCRCAGVVMQRQAQRHDRLKAGGEKVVFNWARRRLAGLQAALLLAAAAHGAFH